MNTIQETIWDAQFLIEQIKHCKSQIKDWEKSTQGGTICTTGGTTAYTHAMTGGGRNAPDRPEVASAIVFAKQLIITALNQELTRLEAELSTYTITKQ